MLRGRQVFFFVEVGACRCGVAVRGNFQGTVGVFSGPGTIVHHLGGPVDSRHILGTSSTGVTPQGVEGWRRSLGVPPARESTGRRRFYVLSPCILRVRDCRVFQSPPGVSSTHGTVGEALSGHGSCAVIPPLVVCGCSEPPWCVSSSQECRGGVSQVPC